jgi:hypothetical protein
MEPMNLTAVLLAPVLLLISAVGGSDEQGDPSADQDRAAATLAARSGEQDVPDWPIGMIRSFAPDSAWQVHIEQRMTIRIAPRGAAPVPHDMFSTMPQRATGPRFAERKVGKCLPVAGIAGVEPNGPNNLILFMRDRRMINAELERSCPARSFYSGFYLSPSTDGNVCIGRDTLLSRSGTACKVSRLRQLVGPDE